MKSIKFGFVILHYQAYDMTVECVETLRSNFDFIDKYIVIVDNNSPNNSGVLLTQKYSSFEDIKVIRTSENFGFAKGNNIGYEYLKENFDSQFIIVMNNDVLITQKNFFELIESIFLKEKFAVLGPDVFCPKSSIHQNPFRLKPIGKKEFRKMFFMERLKRIIGYSLFMKIIQPILDSRHKGDVKYSDVYKQKYINPVLHGSCLIFSKLFIDEREYAFNPKTYMFFEENILHLECMKQGLKTFYTPEIQVNHMEDVATDLIFNKNVKKENWKTKNTVKSMKVYKRMI